MSLEHTCTAHALERTAAAFRDAGGLRTGSNCPEPSWLDAFVQRSSSKPSFDSRLSAAEQSSASMNPGRILVVGCNKADNVVGWLGMLRGDATFNLGRWYGALVDRCSAAGAAGCPTNFSANDCSICGPCTQYPLLRRRDARPATEAVCVEALPVTAAVLKASVHSLGWPIHVVQAAVTAKAKPAYLPFPASIFFGAENLGLSGQNGNWVLWKKANKAHNASGDTNKKYPIVQVRTTTVDLLVHEGGYQAEVLLIDAEGYDADVLQGASSTLASGKVGYIEFEYNFRGSWRQHTLKGTIDYLDSHGFNCYWAGKRALYQITRCWHPSYGKRDFKDWANVACANRAHQRWHRALQQVSVPQKEPAA